MIQAEIEPQTDLLVTPVSAYATATNEHDAEGAEMWSAVTGNLFEVIPQLARLPDGTVFVAAFCVQSKIAVWGF